MELVARGTDVIAIQESHLHRSELGIRLPGYVAYRAELPSDPKRGLITYLKSPISDYTVITRRIGGSELWLLVAGFPFQEDKPGLIVNIHWRQMNNQQFDVTIRRLEKQSRKYQILLQGDFNIHPPPGINWDTGWIGDGKSRLGQIIQASRGILGGYASSPISRIDLRQQSILDYIVGPVEWFQHLDNTEVLSYLQGSDHLPVSSRWNMGIKTVRRPRKMKPNEVITTACNLMSQIRESKAEDITGISNILSEEMDKHNSSNPARKNRKFWSAAGPIQFWRRRMVTAAKQYHKAGRSEGPEKENWKIAKKRFRIVAQDVWYSDWHECLTKLEQAGKVDPRRYFNTFRTLGNNEQKTYRSIKIIGPNGELLGKGATLDCIIEHLQKVVSPRPQHSMEFTQHLQSLAQKHRDDASFTDEHNKTTLNSMRTLSECGKLLDPISEEDIAGIMLLMKSNTASGSDGIPMGLWLGVFHDQGVRQMVADCFNRIMDKGTTPDKWKEVICALIPKNDHATEAKDYRCIMISQCIYRIFTKIIQIRLRNFLEKKKWLQVEQAGFRKNRSTVDQVMVLTEILERRKRNGDSTCLVFIDYRQAYDSIHIEALRTALILMDLPDRFIHLIMDIYRESKVLIRLDGGAQDSFQATCGLRQGCPLAPLMFIILVNSLILQLREGPTIEIPGVKRENWHLNNEQRLNSLWFADDAVLITNSEWGAQQLVNSLQNWSAVWGLQLNVAKCACLKVTSEPVGLTCPIVVNGASIPEVRKYVYLGCLIDRSISRAKMATHRLDKAKGIMTWVTKALYSLWHAPLSVRQRAARAFVVGSCMYGSEVWAFGSAVKKLEQLIGRLGGAILGTPRKSNLTIAALEAGLPNIALTVAVKRWKLVFRAVKCGGPLWLLGKTSHYSKTIVYELQMELLGMELPVHTQERLVRNQLDLKEWSTLERAQLEKNPQRLESTKKYICELWQMDSLKSVGGTALGKRFYHHLRLDVFYNWKRICWNLRLDNQTSCGWCKVDTEETRTHLILDCTAWTKARASTIQQLISKLKLRKFNNEEILLFLLGGTVREERMGQEDGRLLLLFLDIIRRTRDILLRSLKRQT